MSSGEGRERLERKLRAKKASAAPDRGDPVSVCRAYMGRLGADDWAGAAALVDRSALQDLKKALIQIIAAGPDSIPALRSMFPRLKTNRDVEKARSEDLFADFLAKVFSSSEELHEAMARAEFEILGRAEQGPDLAHVVYRYRYTLAGAVHGKVAAVSLGRSDGEWAVLATEEIKGLIHALSLQARMSRDISLPGPRVDGGEEPVPDGEAGEDEAPAAPSRFDLASLLRDLGRETLEMEDLEAEILPLLLSDNGDVVLGGMKLMKPLLSTRSIERILEQSTSPDHRVRWHCLDCLGAGVALAPDAVYRVFMDTLRKDSEPWVRKKAASELARYVHAGMLADLKPLLGDDDLGLVTLLLDAAAGTQSTAKLLFLEEIVLSHPQVKIRDYARELLRDISQGASGEGED